MHGLVRVGWLLTSIALVACGTPEQHESASPSAPTRPELHATGRCATRSATGSLTYELRDGLVIHTDADFGQHTFEYEGRRRTRIIESVPDQPIATYDLSFTREGDQMIETMRTTDFTQRTVWTIEGDRITGASTVDSDSGARLHTSCEYDSRGRVSRFSQGRDDVVQDENIYVYDEASMLPRAATERARDALGGWQERRVTLRASARSFTWIEDGGGETRRMEGAACSALLWGPCSPPLLPSLE